MNSQGFSMVALVAALLLGYGLLVDRDDTAAPGSGAPVILGYYLKDAIVTETGANGAPQLRFAAAQAVQNPADNSVELTAVRSDYFDTDRPTPLHWVVNSDRAQVLSANNAAARLTLLGNVVARTDSSKHALTLRTDTLQIDTAKRSARTSALVQLDGDGHRVTGRGLMANLKTGKLTLLAAVETQLAAQVAEPAAGEAPKVSLPSIFSSESFSLDINTNVLVLAKVRSKEPPYIEADSARTTGRDENNNQVVLSGHVRIELPGQGQLQADTATITVRNGRVVQARTSGNPVTFEQQRPATQRLAQGRANVIDYDIATQLLKFSGAAWFSNGQVELSTDNVEYDLAKGQARSPQNQPAERTNIVIKNQALNPSPPQ
jgi:LPS export ABC transporter protein LptC/lipopolysaccharide transport protein LptA